MWAQCVQGLGVSRSSIRPRTRKGLPAEAAVAGSGSAAVALGRVRVPSEDPLPVPCLRSPHGAGSTPLGRTTALGLGGSSLRSGSPPPPAPPTCFPKGQRREVPTPSSR